MYRLWGLWIAATLGLGAYVALVLLDRAEGTLRDEHTSTTISLYLIAVVGFVLAAWWNERRTIPTLWFWAIPIASRLLLWLTDPTLSDDVYRYIWDGHLLTRGVNPYSYAISASEVDGFEIVARTLANNPDLSSPYLPVAQFLFAAVVLVAPDTPTSMQVVMTGFDLATAFLLYRLLPAAGLPARRTLLYLWNPLVIIELAHGAHIDGAMVFLAVLAVWASVELDPDGGAGGQVTAAEANADRRSMRAFCRSLVSPLALGFAVLTRPIPLLLTPALFWRWSWLQRFAFAIVTVGLVVPFGFGVSGWGLGSDPSGVGVFGSARVYSQDFRFNAIISAWLERTLGDSPGRLSLATGAIMAAVGFVIWVLARRTSSGRKVDVRRTLRLMVVLIAAYVLITPVLHPWYLVILLALLPFTTPADGESLWRWWLTAPWMYLLGALPLSYLTYRDPAAFGELNWVRRVEWFPTIALLVIAGGIYMWFTAARSGADRNEQRLIADRPTD